MRSEVLVIGAGAAGMMAAWRAASRGRRVVLLEKNSKPGVKILMSGGTRCNLTHHTDRRGIVQAFGDQGRFLHSALAALGPAELVAWFAQSGVATKVEETGKVFPVSNSAVDVQQALVRRCREAEVDLRLKHGVTHLERDELGFVARTEQGNFQSRQLVVTTGGRSYPGCGTTGDAYAWLADWGHTIVAPVPALVPLKVTAPWLVQLAGLTMPETHVEVRLAGVQGKSAVLAQRRGSLLFTHVGVSGPVVMDVSRAVSRVSPDQSLVLRCDFLPGEPLDQTMAWVRTAAAEEGRRPVAAVLSTRWPRRLVELAMSERRVPIDRRGADLSKVELRELVEFLRQLELPVRGTLGFAKAEVTAGGVSLREVSSQTMGSKLIPGLFLAGEVLDLDGPIGGFNFQAAFSTGYLAGSSLA
ncbi:MAG: NAD(P)/FAD-dependent oxidoreductase [Pirellulales bacterium]